MKPEYIVLRIRNAIGIPFKPERELEKLSISPGQTVLDFGCGIGSFTIPLARSVGPQGKVIALDIEPSALSVVEKNAQRNKLMNIITVLSDCKTDLSANSVDLALFIGVLPSLDDPGPVLQEIHRVLKSEGCLATRRCFRISREEVIDKIAGSGYFEMISESGHMISFKPQ
jgi:ubiquinone/menaquinone biosynthesis C-methylase UbiE